MIKLEYVGNRPVITPNGISFKAAKQDKFEFVEPATHLVEELQAAPEQSDVVVRPKEVYSQSKIMDQVYKIKPDFEAIHEERIASYKQHLEEEIMEVDNYKTMKEIERETLKNNYRFMRNYRIQRATNKIVYETLINEAVKIIHDKKIHSIETPFSMTFLHLLNSVKSTLPIEYKNIIADIKTMLDKEHPYAKVFIKYV